MKVALKCLHNSQDITADFLKEVESNILVHYTAHIVRYFDPLKRPNVEELRELLWNYYYDNKHDNDSEITKQIDEANKINFKLSSLTVQTTSSSTKPKNANNNVGIEYSESIKVDFTNLYINSDDCA
ncbi:kinase-like domain-containing protein [Rhizophagus irregularis DAOM 181602=DAOM 197198]|nr:kinase-like domain-containing protein [Rhizophagus irregularis DAOM 181602=DAOM 197198]